MCVMWKDICINKLQISPIKNTYNFDEFHTHVQFQLYRYKISMIYNIFKDLLRKYLSCHNLIGVIIIWFFIYTVYLRTNCAGTHFTKLCFHHNSKSMEIECYPHLNFNALISTDFCTCHHSAAFMTCEKNWSNIIAWNGIAVKQNFHGNRILRE